MNHWHSPEAYLTRKPRRGPPAANELDEANLSTPHDYSKIALTRRAAILWLVRIWLAEHWPAMAIGGALGLLCIALPAWLLAPGLVR